MNEEGWGGQVLLIVVHRFRAALPLLILGSVVIAVSRLLMMH